jgi:hypothetical protein
METKEFYILTPESTDVLNNVNTLTKGMLNLPTELFFEQDSETPCPYMNYANNSNDVLSNSDVAERKYLIHQSK